MVRSIPTLKRIVLPITLVLAVVIVAAIATVLLPTPQIPVTGGVDPEAAYARSPKTLEMETGYHLERDQSQNKAGQVVPLITNAGGVDSASVYARSLKSIEMSTGYNLALDQSQNKNTAPKMMVNPGSKNLETEPGYHLERDQSQNKNTAP